MHRHILAAAAAAAIASPAVARDGSAYVGLEGGLLLPGESRFEVKDPDGELGDELFRVDHKRGLDIDLIAGYDFGMGRAEVELGHKRAGHDAYELDFFDEEDELKADGRTRVTSLMGNLLLDIGNESGMAFYAGAGAGWARVKHSLKVVDDEEVEEGTSLSKSSLAWQLIAGVRTAVSNNIDLGVKYRYFQTRRLKFTDGDEEFGDAGISSRFRSHSLLASLIYNLAAPVAVAPLAALPPTPPSAAVAPATQICPDGSVVLAADPCPIPPPPSAQPERG